MTVDDLRQELAGIDGDTLVVMSRDEEGSGFSPLYEVSTAQRYYPNAPHPGDVPNPEDYDDSYEGMDWDPAIVLWPVH